MDHSSARTVGESITLQVGNYANFVGTHLFNLQESCIASNEECHEFNKNVFWKGSSRSPIFTPRAIVIDLKDNFPIPVPLTDKVFKSAGGTSTLEKDTDAGATGTSVFWDGPIEQISTTGCSEDDTDAGSLDESVKKRLRTFGGGKQYWGDYTHRRVTPDGSFVVPAFTHNTEVGLSSFSQGQEIWSLIREDVTDQMRRYAEQCDCLESFHLLVDEDDGFSGIASGILQEISEDYEKKACIGLGLSPPRNSDENFKDFRKRICNTALLWNHLNNDASVFTSLGLSENIFVQNQKYISLPYLQSPPMSYAESSFAIGVALDTLISAYSRNSSKMSIKEWSSFLSSYSRKMTMVGLSVPFPYDMRTSSFESTIQHTGLNSFASITPGVKFDPENATGNYFAIRGISNTSNRTGGEYKTSEIISTFESHCQKSCPRSYNSVDSVASPIQLTHPNSAIINHEALTNYNVGIKYFQGHENCWRLPTAASAHNTTEVGNLIEQLISSSSTHISKGRINTSSSCDMDGLEPDDYNECMDNIKTLRDAYRD